MAISRNAPCPCGSGKKYKHCCLGKPKTRRRLRFLLSIAGTATLGLAVFLGWRYGLRTGVLTGVAGTVGIGIYLAVRNPARSRGRKGADSINFGR